MPNERYRHARRFAEDLHAGQVRRGSEQPYFAHLEAVAALVLAHGGDEEEAIAALFHDALEDQGDAYESRLDASRDRGREALSRDLEALYGPRVRAIVALCTDDEDFEKPAEGELGSVEAWRQRKEHHMARLRGAEDLGAIRVACADKLHNAESVLDDYARDGEALWQRFRSRTRANQIWYFGTMAEIFRAHAEAAGDGSLIRLVKRLESAVAALEGLA